MNASKEKYAGTVETGEKQQFVIPQKARGPFDNHPKDAIILFGVEKHGIAIPHINTYAKYDTGIFSCMIQENEREAGA